MTTFPNYNSINKPDCSSKLKIKCELEPLDFNFNSDESWSVVAIIEDATGRLATAEVQAVSNSSNTNEIKNKSWLWKYAGMAILIAASIIFSLVILLVKLLHDSNSGFSPSGLLFWRYLGCILQSVPLIYYLKYQVKGNYQFQTETRGLSAAINNQQVVRSSVFSDVWPLLERGNLKTALGLLIRGILMSGAHIFQLYSLEYLTLGDTSVISNGSPILVTILAHFLLGEKTGVIPILAAVLALLGVFIIIRPPALTGQTSFDKNMLIGAGYAGASMLCIAFAVIVMRKIRRVNLVLLLLSFAIVGMVQALILTLIFDEFQIPRGSFKVSMVTAVTLLSFLGQICSILGVKLETAGVASLFRTTDVAFTLIFQFVFLGLMPDFFSSIGGAIIFLGIIMVALQKYALGLPEGSRKWKIWSLFLHSKNTD